MEVDAVKETVWAELWRVTGEGVRERRDSTATEGVDRQQSHKVKYL